MELQNLFNKLSLIYEYFENGKYKKTTFFIIFIRKNECRTIFLKLIKMHVIIILKMDKNVRISINIERATSLIAKTPPGGQMRKLSIQNLWNTYSVF